MILQVKTTPDNFFRTYIGILNPILKLRKREAEILEAFLRIHYVNKARPDVNRLLFSPSILRSIREKLNLTVAAFNMHKYRMRKKEILLGRTINPLITKNYPVDGKLSITFTVNLIRDSK